MAAGECRRCGARPPPGARFCTQCGASLARPGAPADPVRTPAPAAARATPDGPRLIECDECGAGNAASRPLCARCGTPLRDEVPGGDALPDAATATVVDSAAGRTGRRESPSVLLALVVLAGLITAGVLLALVTSRVTADDEELVPEGLTVQSAVASSSLPDHPASRAIDGDPATAWTEAAEGAGTDQWIEVAMAQQAEVRRLLIWNGDQRDEQHFEENGRASAVRIEVADRQFRVGLLDIRGPQAIDLPDGVTADRVRIVIEEAIPGSRYTDLAISEIVVEGG